MSILRVGPWGNPNEWYKPEPFDTTIDSSYYPINCALEDWPSQTWAWFATTDSGFVSTDPDYTYSKADLGEVVSKTSDASLTRYTPTVLLVFCYQATEEFNVNLNWEFTGDTGDNFPSLTVPPTSTLQALAEPKSLCCRPLHWESFAAMFRDT